VKRLAGAKQFVATAPERLGRAVAETLEREQFEKWNREKSQFELSWRSNESLLLASIPADIEALKEFAWHVWQHAISSAERRYLGF
jgi:hypothetical protein